MQTTISSFREIKWDANVPVIILCDIDDTVLTFRDSVKHAFAFVNSFLKENPDSDEILRFQAHSKYTRLLDTPTPTDMEGYVDMLNRVNESRFRHGPFLSDFCFLTARSQDGHEFTLQNLADIGMTNAREYRIYYTGNIMLKGEFIQQYMRDYVLDMDNTQVIFIDDNRAQLESVSSLFPKITCYQMNAFSE